MMHFKSGLELTELQNMTVPEDDNISNESNDFTEVENGQINSKFISDRESRRSLTNSHLEKRKCDEYIPGTTSLSMSVFNLSNAIMGSGILGLAFALANTGILLFLQQAVGRLRYQLLQGPDPGSLASREGGSKAGKAPPCRPAASGWVWSSSVGPLETYWCDFFFLGYLGYTSGFSLSCMVFFLIVVIYKKFQISCMSIEQNSTISANVTDMCTPKYVTFNSKTVYALPTIAFAFVCHPSVLPIYSELKDRSQKKMQMVSNISFFAMFVMYFLTAIFGYLTFYEKLQPDLLHKYQGQNDILILTVQLAVIVAVILTVPVLFFTVRSSLFELTKKTKFHLCRHVLVTIILLLIIDLLVIFIPSMKDIFGVVGVTSANMLIFILPSSLYLKITNQDADKGTQRIWAALFLALGVLFSLISIPLVIYDWACSSSSDEGH
ncbi:Sodium-coupled neutral amino acid transporter 1 [Cricetulus griseus]|uniref:Sodium-coupled neutral amino acid transporter 1 n=1 Tax=Cricetulus griseus TaxID=10029 RepID=G3I5M3_CRIGR|nr:Sodium-coupled neutral amino acid transporter 1 [Cricetulus griseus]